MKDQGELTARPFDLLLRHKTYEVAAHQSNTDEPAAEVLNNATKHVASRTLDRGDWQNSILINGVVGYARALKASDGPNPDARQREPRSDAPQAGPRRRVLGAGLPAGARLGRASVR